MPNPRIFGVGPQPLSTGFQMGPMPNLGLGPVTSRNPLPEKNQWDVFKAGLNHFSRSSGPSGISPMTQMGLDLMSYAGPRPQGTSVPFGQILLKAAGTYRNMQGDLMAGGSRSPLTLFSALGG
jgi:hypothetical protein